MIIEFQTPYKKISEKLISDIENEILKLLIIHRDISRAEIIMKEEETLVPGKKQVCEIKLTAFGNDLHTYAIANNFEKSALAATRELRKMVNHEGMKQLKTVTTEEIYNAFVA
jgi:ribosome-associated translation inhibitor RaiA